MCSYVYHLKKAVYLCTDLGVMIREKDSNGEVVWENVLKDTDFEVIKKVKKFFNVLSSVTD